MRVIKLYHRIMAAYYKRRVTTYEYLPFQHHTNRSWHVNQRDLDNWGKHRRAAK